MAFKESKIFGFVVLIVFICSNSNLLYAQDELALRLKTKPIGVIYQKNRMYKGSEFLFDTWNKGEILFSNGQKVDNLQLNFNAYTNDLLYAIRGNTAVVVSKYQFKSFKIYSNNQGREFVLYSDSAIDFSVNDPLILEVLYVGEIKAYANRMYKVNYNLMKANPFGRSVYYSEENYYVIIEGELISNPQNVRSYCKFYEKTFIKKLVRTNSLDLKVEEDLISFLRILEAKHNGNSGSIPIKQSVIK